MISPVSTYGINKLKKWSAGGWCHLKLSNSISVWVVPLLCQVILNYIVFVEPFCVPQDKCFKRIDLLLQGFVFFVLSVLKNVFIKYNLVVFEDRSSSGILIFYEIFEALLNVKAVSFPLHVGFVDADLSFQLLDEVLAEITRNP